MPDDNLTSFERWRYTPSFQQIGKTLLSKNKNKKDKTRPVLVYIKRLLAKSSSKPVNHIAILTREWLVNLRCSILLRFTRIFDILSAISHTFTSLGLYYPSIQGKKHQLVQVSFQFFHCLKGTTLLAEQENERK